MARRRARETVPFAWAGPPRDVGQSRVPGRRGTVAATHHPADVPSSGRSGRPFLGMTPLALLDVAQRLDDAGDYVAEVDQAAGRVLRRAALILRREAARTCPLWPEPEG